MGPFGMGNGIFDSDMIDLTIIISALPFSFEVYV
jgi:hypothetical protein